MDQREKHWFCLEENGDGFYRRWWGYGTEEAAHRHKELGVADKYTRCDWFHPSHKWFHGDWKVDNLDHEVGLILEWLAKKQRESD